MSEATVMTRGPATSEKDAFVQRLTRILVGAIRDVERTHEGDPATFASSVAKRVATQLWGLTNRDQHKDMIAWLKHARGQLGYGQRELAEKLGVSRVTVARWETGHMLPTQEHQDAIRRLIAQ